MLGVVPQVSGGSDQELDEEIGLAAAGNTDVGRCRVEEVGTMTYMVGELEGTVATEQVGITEAMLWPLLMLLLGLGEVRVLKVAGEATT